MVANKVNIRHTQIELIGSKRILSGIYYHHWKELVSGVKLKMYLMGQTFNLDLLVY